ncbi:MAG: NAD(P)H-hydrate dehydratase [Candidatus Sumerlaeaceae bacterium]|nr:NAD(P)H-hydrate dehydratase [Candidatus Sumerlaeaceae bacterium]
MRVATAEQMRAIDRAAQQTHGVTGEALMERAGADIAAEILRRFSPRQSCIVCGKGNNAGDGFVVARRLKEAGVGVAVVCVTPPADLSGDAAGAFQRMVAAGINPVAADQMATLCSNADLVVDALLGIGARGPLQGDFAKAVATINAAERTVVSVDVPSGVRELADGEDPGPVVRATLTIAIGLPKRAMLTMPFAPYCGEIVVTRINFPAELLDDPALRLRYESDRDLREWIPARPPDANKSTFGRVGIVAGSGPYMGAALLCARAALRAGCGLAYLFTPIALNPIAKVGLPEAVTVLVRSVLAEWLDDASAQDILTHAADMDAWVIGPGLGTGPAREMLVRTLLEQIQAPIVLDADGLTCLAINAETRQAARGKDNVLLTPHPGEMARLTGLETAQVQAARIETAAGVATQEGVHVLLKGACSVLARPDGDAYLIPGCEPALAKGGTGDVLAGLIAGLAAQGLPVWRAGLLGARLHLEAGRIAAQTHGPRSCLAREVADAIGPAFARLEAAV